MAQLLRTLPASLPHIATPPSLARWNAARVWAKTARSGAARKLSQVASGRRRVEFVCRGSGGEAPVLSERPLVAPPEDGNRTKNLKWYAIEEKIIVGTSPQTSADVVAIANEAGATALLCLLTEEEWESPKIDWDTLKLRPGIQEVVVARLSMKDNDPVDQGLALPEAVRAVASLIAGGRKVYINCTSATTRSSLVALGYLTFVQAIEFYHAMDKLKAKFPEANPSVDSWEEAKAKLLAGELKRVTELAHSVYKRRSAKGIPGTAAGDWLEAQRLLIAELFARRVSTDVILSSALAQVAILKSREDTADELQELKTRASDAQAAADSADNRVKELIAQLSSLSSKDTTSTGALASAKEQTELLSKQIEELLLQQEYLKKEARAKGSLVDKENESFSLKIAQLEKSLLEEKRTVAEANNYNSLLSEQIADLEKQISESTKALTLANEKVALLSQQLEEAIRRETITSQELKLAQTKLDSLSDQVFNLEKKDSLRLQDIDTGNQRVHTLTSELKQLKMQLEKSTSVSEEQRQRAESLSHQLITIKANESSSKAYIAELKKRIEMLESEESLKLKKEADKDKSAAVKISKLQSEIADLKEQLVTAMAREEEQAVQASNKFSQLQKEIEVFRNELLATKEESTFKEAAANEKIGQLEGFIVVLKDEISLAKKKEQDLMLQLSSVSGKPEALLELQKSIADLRTENSRLATTLRQAEEKASEASTKSNSLSVELGKSQELVSQLTLTLEHANKALLEEKSKREKELEAESASLKPKLNGNQKYSDNPELIEQISILKKSLAAAIVLAIALPIAVYAFFAAAPSADLVPRITWKIIYYVWSIWVLSCLPEAFSRLVRWSRSFRLKLH